MAIDSDNTKYEFVFATDFIDDTPYVEIDIHPFSGNSNWLVRHMRKDSDKFCIIWHHLDLESIPASFRRYAERIINMPAFW